MKKIINVITLIVMTSVNIMTPFSYADSLGDDFLETENIETTSQETETFEDEEKDETDTYSNEDLQIEEDSQPSELPIEDEIQEDEELAYSPEENIQDNEGDTQSIDFSDNFTDVESGEVEEIDTEITIDSPVNIIEGQIDSGENQQAKTGTNNTVLDSSFLSTEEEDVLTSSSFSGDNEENLEQSFTGENLDDYSELEKNSQDSLTNDSERQDEENLDIDEEGKRFDSENIQDIVDKIRYFFTEQKSAKYIKYDEDDNEIGIITLRDPETSSTITIMDRNLGAEDTGIGEKSYGYYFQWGNNHGIQEVNSSNKTTKKAIYGDSYFSKGYDGNGLFIVGDKDYREDGNHYNSLWGDDSKEISRQASCPTGYHIPTAKEWNELMGIWGKIHTQYTEINEEGETISKTRYTASSSLKNIISFKDSVEKCNQGDSECVDEDNLSEIIPVLSSELKLPLAGSYDEDGNFINNVGIYWSTTSKNGSEAVVFDIDAYFTDIKNETLGYKSQGHSIRCFQNVEKEETPTTVISQYEQENQNLETSPSVDLSSDLNGENEETENLQFGTGENVAIDMLKEIVDNENNNSTLDEYIQTEETTENIIPTDSSVEVLEGQVGSKVSTKTSITSVVAGETSSLTGEVLQSEEEINEQEEFTGINLELATAWETLNAELIKKVGLYNNVIVNVEAPAGTFPEGTYANIRPIVSESRLDEIKGKIIGEDETVPEDSEIVAFDISFIYTLSGGKEIEVQPLEGKVVKVTFDYSNNDELSEADNNDGQKVKVFHIDDKDDEGNKVEKGEEVVEDVTNKVESEENGIAVADAESFSVYVLVSSSSLLEPFTVTYNLNGGYWTEEGEVSTGNKDITYEYDSTVTLVSGKKYYKPTSTYKTPSKAGNTCNGKKCMFKGWYTDIGGNNRWNGTVSSDMTVYAKWLPFDDLHVYFLVDETNIIHETIMDRNLGATEIYSQDYSNQKAAARGDYFQWGNNYAFGTGINGLEQITENTRVPASIWELGVPSKYYSSVYYKKDKETWTIGNSKGLWGGLGDTDSSIGEGTTYEGRQGPCPDGYHIPSAISRKQLFDEWNLIYNYVYSNVMNIDKGNNNHPIVVGIRNGLGIDLLLPPTGRWGGTNLGNTSDDLSYWASSHNENDEKTAYGFYVGKFGIQPRGVQSVGGGGDGESRGRAIRCFKNPENKTSYLSGIDLNGGTGGIISILNGEVKSLKEPSRSNDEFRGWYTTFDYSGDPIGIGSGLSQGDSLYAKWCADGSFDDGSQCINGYTITFDTDGGTSIPSQIVISGETGTRPVVPEKDGYEFSGWYLTGLQTEFDFNTPITSNITIYAKWTPIEYTISYELNGGEVAISNPITYTIETQDFTLHNPSRVGYDFLGWSGTDLPGCSVEEHSTCSGTVSIQQGSTGNRVFEAIWDAEKYNLNFDSLGGSEVPTQRIVYGETGTRPVDPTKDGYEFSGWYYTGLETEFDFDTPITSNITIYAKWTLKTYTISYELNGGEVATSNPTTYTKESSEIILNNPSRDWYIFEGWSGTNLPVCSMEDTSNCIKTVTIPQGSTGDRTYEAIWGYVKYDLNFDSLGGSEVTTQRVIHGETGTKPADPTKDGYSFEGWYWTGLETPFNFTGTAITGDITVYAKWNLVNYNITYNLDGGTGLVNTGVYTVETQDFTLNNPTKLNYDFIGWSGTNLSGCSVEDQTTCNKNVIIPQGSTGDRVYEAIYDCAYGRKLDGTCNIVRGEDGLIDYGNWEYNDLEVDLSVTEPIKIVIMDRNLGAAISGTGENTNAFGFYYQWGNNYGFRNVIEKTSTEQVDASAYGPENYYVSDTFILQDSLAWDAPSNYDLWGGTGDNRNKRGNGDDVARQGPCPTGYHVPSMLEWIKLNSFADTWRKSEKATDVCSEFNDNRVCVLSKILKLPKSGNLLGKDGSFQANVDDGPIGRYWSSSRYDDNRAYRYRINGNWDMNRGQDNSYLWYNSNGMSVRCFKNVSSKPIVYELSGGVQTGNQTSTVVWWNESAGKILTIPTKTGFVFEGWYLTSGYEEGTRVTTNVISDYSDNESVTLYAKWKDPEYKTITYNANGGTFSGGLLSTGIVFKEDIISGNYIALTNVQFPNRVGYMFDGWYLTGGETEWTGYVNNSTEEQTVYAKWLGFNDLTLTMGGITFTIMDRNLGATDYATGYTYGSDNEQNNQSRVGKYYQWGNNYGFTGTKNVNVGTNNFVYNTNDFGPGNYFSTAEYVFNTWKWGNTHKNLWGGLYLSSGDETRQGPCPVNYHVPTKNEWDKTLNLFNAWKQTEEGSAYCNSLENSGAMYCFSARLGLPFAGYLDGKDSLKEKGTYGTYRTSNQRDANDNPYRMRLSNMKTETLSNGYGNPIRCFKNTERKALSFESKGGEIVDAPTETVRWWETTSSLPTPTRFNSTFSGWYLTPGYDEGTKVSVNYIGTGSGPVTLYAKWECEEGYEESEDGNSCVKKGYTVTITSNNEDFGIVTSGSVAAQNGVSITTSGNELTIGEVKVMAIATGNTQQYSYTFSGWNNNCGSTLTGNCTIEAQFDRTVNKYKVTINANSNSGSVTSGEITVEYGTSITTSGNELKIGEEVITATGNARTDQYTHRFVDWTNNCGENVTTGCEITANFESTVNKYLITFTDGDGEIIQSGMIAYGATPAYTGTQTPTKTSTAQTGYTFNNTWSPDIVPVVGEATYEAQFNEWTREYLITWNYRDENGDRKSSTGNVEYGKQPEAPSLPAISQTAQTGYTFTGWNPAVSEVTTGATYTAQYEETTREYMITFVDGDGKTIQTGMVVYGSTPAYTGTETPNKTATAQTGYTFNGNWSPTIHSVEGEETYIAQFNEETRSYDIIWKYETQTGIQIETGSYLYGAIPSHSGNNYQTAQTGYTFSGWKPEITSVTGPAEYEAEYNETTREYLITFVDGDGKTIQTGMVMYGVTPAYTGTETPTKTATPQYSYNFNYTWEPEIIPVETGAEYTAQFDEIINKYIVTINADANSGSVSTGTIEIEYGTSITESGNELKIGDITVIATAKLSDAQYTHTFIDWTNSCASAVTTGCEITANFESTINEYQITFDSNGGSDVDTQTKQYGLTVDEPPDPNKTGYGFSGWFYEGLETKFDFENTTISGDLTLYAKWTPIIYTISYNYNSGSLTGESTNPSNYTIETDTFTLNNPERVGYDFLGWTGIDFEGLSGNVTIMSGSTGNREYTANWQARNVTVTINHHLQDLNAETNELLPSYTLSGSTTSQELADSTITLSNYKQTIEGYTYSSGGVNGEPTTTTTVSPDGSREIDLYYTRNSYVLTITSDTGANITGTSPIGNYYYGAEIILSGDVDSDCFMWSGWDVQGTTLINNINNTSFHMPANDVTVNASVTEKTYNVLFVGNGEDSGEMEELTGLRCTQPVELPVNKFGKVGHTFSGWTTTLGGEKEYEDGDTITTLTTGNNATVSLIAVWDINYYPVIFQNYNGVVLDSQSLPYLTIPEYKGSTAPSRAADAQYTYSFTGWTPEFTAVEGPQVYTAVFSTTINEYTITWDVDGTLITQTYQYGQTPNPEGINIAKASTPQYEYTFTGWSPSISKVTGNATYTAQYTETLRKYTVTWRNHNGALLDKDENIPYGTVPHYNGVTPVRTGDAQHSYTFTGWNDGTNTYGKDEGLPGVSGNVTYSAVFVGNTNEYTVTWKNEDGTILEYDENVPYGTMPSYDGETPYKTGDQQYDYVFAGWTPATGEVTSDAVYAATYTPVLKKYTVTWKNSDGSTIKTDTGVEYGTTPEYIGDTPTSGGNAEYSYEFTGWNPVVGAIHGDTTYTAVYTHKKNKYTVTWANRDGTVLETVENVEYGTTPTHGDITPIHTGDAHYSYNFIGWEPEISAVQGNITYTAQFEEIENYYNVTFENDDGSTLLETRSYVYGTTWDQIIKPTNTPTKAEDVQYTYTFAGWTPSISEIIGDVTFKATYTPTLKTYTVTWNNYDGTELKIDENVPYGTTPSYSGETPTKPATAQYSYVFIGWEPEISAVQGDITYTAKFTGVTEVYTVTWQNEDGAVLEVDHDVIYGTMPEYNGDTPYKTGNMEYDYIFDGWTPEPVAVSTTTTYTAKFRPETKKYTVTRQNEDGVVLETDLEVPYGTVPHYDGATPVKTGNAQYSYEFDKWSPDVNTVQGDMTYTATYTEIINKYTVTWENEDGTVLETDEDIPYGTKPEYHGETPTKTGNVQYSYSFKGWDKEVLEIEGDTTYIARYTQSVNEYLIAFVDGDENIIQTGMVAYGENPAYTGAETPTKTRTQEYTYTFNGNWSPAIHSVDGPETYTAQFDATTNKYTITIKANTNSGSVSTGIIEIEYGTPIIISGNKLKIGEEIEVVATVKPSDAQYTHEFSGWNNSCGTTLQSGCIIEAEFRSIVNEYLIIFVDGDENIIQTGMMAYGENPAYTGTQTPNKTSTPQTGYTFNGNWSPAIHSVDGPETYIAQFDASTNKYIITINANTISGSVSTGIIEIEYGTLIIESGNKLKIGEEIEVVATAKPSDAQYTHEFSGWNNTCGTTLQSGCIIEAEFKSAINKYTITWKDRDGTQLERDENVPYGVMPSYDGLTPTSGGDAQYSYRFNGWNPVTGTVKGNAVYTATYIQSINEYLIIFVDGDGKIIQTGMVAYGSTPNYTGSTPTKARTQEYTYMFNGTWNPTIHSVTTGETYIAQFTPTKNKYNLTIEVNTNSGSINTGLITAEYGTPITISGNELKIGETTVVAMAKPSDAQYTHEFSGWNNSCGTTLKNNCTIKAEFRSIVNKYTVTWQNEDGLLLETDENVLYGIMPHYDGIEPTKPGDGSGDYIFNGWNPAPTIVIGDIVYTAKYKEKVSPDGGNNEGKRRSGGGGRRNIIEEIDQHGSAEKQDMNEAEKEVFDAYKRAYKYGITTMNTEQEADPDGYVIRGHLAKMVVNFVANVLGKGVPVDTPTQCKRKDRDSEWESEEIKFYAEKACSLGIMGMYMEEFMPNKIVDRAEFGTVVSRLLWGNIYDELDTDNNLYYTKHLKALQESGFMKDIDNPLGRREFRKRVWVTLKRIELEKNKK